MNNNLHNVFEFEFEDKAFIDTIQWNEGNRYIFRIYLTSNYYINIDSYFIGFSKQNNRHIFLIKKIDICPTNKDSYYSTPIKLYKCLSSKIEDYLFSFTQSDSNVAKTEFVSNEYLLQLFAEVQSPYKKA